MKEAKHGEKEKSVPAMSAATSTVTASGLVTSAAVPVVTVGQSKTEPNKIHTSTPRKLVRGQDVWLGKGEEQTR